MDAETSHQLAWKYLQAGETKLALEHALRAHELSRGNLDYLNTLGVAYGEAGQLDLAEATFRKALKRKPGFINALVNLAKSLEKQERLDEARPLYERALTIAPAFPRLATNLARIYSQRGETGRAKSLLERSAKNVDPQDLAMGLALYEADAGETERALARLRAAVADHPDWKLARSSLAHLLLSTAHWREGWTEYVRRRNLFEPRPTELPEPLAAASRPCFTGGARVSPSSASASSTRWCGRARFCAKSATAMIRPDSIARYGPPICPRCSQPKKRRPRGR